ncbi:coiled-coil and C2 domain-containing protein 1A [Pezoporus flaviventris]|uniref:coiled-coil and C2 domain-containing protein 1A n=1 Tax=Pezoporus flaviventris TaxID=889875 RepID=UPI002AB186B2|nr:coiled-coil and C2 domain-containing protein 1A [Pezoporus flaviventris]
MHLRGAGHAGSCSLPPPPAPPPVGEPPSSEAVLITTAAFATAAHVKRGVLLTAAGAGTPLGMEAIEAMAALCMKDPEEEEEGADEDGLMVRNPHPKKGLFPLGMALKGLLVLPRLSCGRCWAAWTHRSLQPSPQVSAPELGNTEALLQERAALYRAAIASTSPGPRLRRFQRGLKTLEAMLECVRKGKPIQEDEIPPPVALGRAPGPPPVPPSPPEEVSRLDAAASQRIQHSQELRSRQHQYKVLALQAKRSGDMATATKCYREAKRFDALLDAVAKGQPVEPSLVPPPPDPLPEEPEPHPTAEPEAKPASPSSAGSGAVLPALQLRMRRYEEAAAAAGMRGDARKARMHERIVKQYQEAIRAHTTGKPVDLSELPVPPGFQPIHGTNAGGERSMAAVLEQALRLVGQEEHEGEDGAKELLIPAQIPAHPSATSGRSQPQQLPPSGDMDVTGATRAATKAGSRAQQQLRFLQSRREQLLEAALGSKRRGDLEGAKLFLRRAKALEPALEASRRGLPVDISKVPEAPGFPEFFLLEPRSGARIPPEAAARFLELLRLLRRQHEICLSHSKQFTQLGNLTETTKFEALAQECRRSLELLQRAHAAGAPVPRHHQEQRTFTTIRSFPELSPSDLELAIMKGMNLPAPQGLAPKDLDTSVRFEFPHPSVEEPQRDKTATVKSTDCPEFRERFRLRLLRGHRGLRRVLRSKGIKFEVTHKGGLFKPDRILGSASLRLDALETTCEVREVLELLDGRRRTGGTLEVLVRLREPLGAPELRPRTEPWLVIQAPGTAGNGREQRRERHWEQATSPRRYGNGSPTPPMPRLHGNRAKSGRAGGRANRCVRAAGR